MNLSTLLNSRSVDENTIRKYIEKHGFGPKTPPLTKSLSADEFIQHYYDKKELMEFSRSIGISTCGLKNDLNDRIELYLRTGHVTVIRPKIPSKRPDSELGLLLNTIVNHYKSDPVTRQFFAEHIPAFKSFSALVQKQIRQRLAEGKEFTYGDVIEMHKTFLREKKTAKKSGQVTKVVHDSCQYNQFFIDYSHDLNSKVHSAKDAWMLVRNSAGEKTYQRYKDHIEEISEILKDADNASKNTI